MGASRSKGVSKCEAVSGNYVPDRCPTRKDTSDLCWGEAEWQGECWQWRGRGQGQEGRDGARVRVRKWGEGRAAMVEYVRDR